MMNSLSPVIVGAGPAGIRAAATLVAAGLKPVVVDEAIKAGGQIYRQPPDGFTRPKSSLYGFESRKADRLHRLFEAIQPQIDYRPGTLVWNAGANHLDLMAPDGTASSLGFSHLLLATGATDRIQPFAGWLTPGVFTLGAAQIALKFQGSILGPRVAFAGTGPLLYLVAYQYAKAGADVVGVFDTARFADKLAALPGLLHGVGHLAKGMYYVAWLRAHGVPLHGGIVPLRVEGEGRVQGFAWQGSGRARRVDCDAVAFGLGLRSETQLADLLGCRFAYDDLNRAWLPERNLSGRSSLPHVFLAGDGAGIAGADAAELAGERAALALLEDAGHLVDRRRIALLERRLQRIAKFRHGLERAFPLPLADWGGAALADDLVLCRCEAITVGSLRQAACDLGVTELNRLKALTRIGMGRCQGRICGAAASAILAAELGQQPGTVGRLRGQAPVKPLPVVTVSHEDAA
ncbi:FAD/NAD(P)-binding oxidoreductase [Ferrovibrio terrae]|uniref:FAD/NAD(P)-dependent oxidoreductase n=1 Tax=Ferrovibrio terrae TaxID=2594003 RepID=UPI003137C5A7